MALFILRKLKVINTFYMITKLALSIARSILWNLRNQRNLRKIIIVFLQWQDNLRFIPELTTAWKVSKYGVFFRSIFSCVRTKFWDLPRNAESIQSECWKIRTKKISVFWHFSRRVLWYLFTDLLMAP